MAKTRYSLLAAITAVGLTLTGCSTADSSKDASATTGTQASTISVEDNYGVQEVPNPAQRIAATDNRSFEILANWGVDLVAAPKKLIPKTVTAYNSDDILDIGNHKEPNLEMLTAAEPDLIINGQRFQKYHDEIAKLNPDAAVVDFEPREDQPWDEELKRHARGLGKTLSKEEDAEKLVADFEKALERAKKAYDPSKKIMAVNVSGGEIGYIAPSKGRTFGPIFDVLNLNPALEVANASDNHEGDDISVEAIAEAKPDYLFVLDRDGAVKADDPEYKPAADVINANAALKNVPAIKDGNVVIAPQDTYTNENIITFTEILNQIADSFEAKK